MGQWNYSYDNLNRLINATAPVSQPTGANAYFAGVQTGWTYDAFGNRLSETQGAVAGAAPTASMPTSSTASFTPASNQLATSSLASGLNYDAAGDITYDGTNSYLYDAEGRICAVQGPTSAGSPLSGYIYDGAGIRVAKASLTTFSCNFATNGFAIKSAYVLGSGGEQVTEFSVSGTTSTWVHTNAFAGGKLLASYHDTDTYFALEDWLGTKRMELTPDGLTATFRSLPYGNGYVASGTAVDATEQHFTGKERDIESGNDYFEARYYSSAMGRFLSPDWSAKEDPVPYAHLDDPQSLNLYAYVLNNPLAKVDPDGHDGWGNALVAIGKEVYNQTIAPALNLASAALKLPQTLAGDNTGPAFHGELKAANADQAQVMTAAAPAVFMATMLVGEGEAAKGAEAATLTFDGARTEAFAKAGMTDAKNVSFSKMDPKTGTVVEFKGPQGAKVAYDAPHPSPGPGHDTQHVGWQTGGGKRSSGTTQKGNIPYKGEQHPSRPQKPSDGK